MADEDDKRRFRLVQGGDDPASYHKGAGLKQLVCHTCKREAGVAYGGPWLEGPASAWEDDGAVAEEGERVLICPGCLARGKVTRIL